MRGAPGTSSVDQDGIDLSLNYASGRFWTFIAGRASPSKCYSRSFSIQRYECFALDGDDTFISNRANGNPRNGATFLFANLSYLAVRMYGREERSDGGKAYTPAQQL
jgi:hypothetical protein